MKTINIFKNKFAFLIAIYFVFAGCSEEMTDKAQIIKPGAHKIILQAFMPADDPSTRIALEEVGSSLNLSAKWKAGDKVKIFFVQDNIKAESPETTIFDITQDGKKCSFSISIPEGIDINIPVDIYAFSGIPGQGVKLIDGNILADISPIKNVKLSDFVAPVWSKIENITIHPSGFELNFNHLGAYELIHLKNSDNISKEISDCSIIPKNSEETYWYHVANGNTAPLFNPESGEIIQKTSTNTQSATPLTIDGEATMTIVSWYVPNGKNIPELSMKLNNLLSTNDKDSKDYAMQPGRAYHINAVWNGILCSMTANDFDDCISTKQPESFTVISENYFQYNSDENVEIRFTIYGEDDVIGLNITWTDRKFINDFTIQLWGGGDGDLAYASSHENFNGKHIKDRLGESNRTIYYKNLKMTLTTTGPYKSITGISIYEGTKYSHIRTFCDKLVYYRDNAQNALLMDEYEPDGETSTYERIEGGLIFYNIYNEYIPGNKVYERINLGGLEDDEPLKVNDLFDDPRLAFT